MDQAPLPRGRAGAGTSTIEPVSVTDLGSPTSSGGTLSPALEMRGVGRSFEGLWVLTDVHLSLEVGSICLVLGRNGSGKSTLMRIASGLLAPSKGHCCSPSRSVYLRGSGGHRHELTTSSALRQVADLSGADARAIPDLLSSVGLQSRRHATVGALSSGERARLALATALIVSPPLICFDEPTGNLDRDGLTVTRGVLRELALRGTAVLVATHDAGALESAADGAVEVRGGSLRLVG